MNLHDINLIERAKNTADLVVAETEPFHRWAGSKAGASLRRAAQNFKKAALAFEHELESKSNAANR